MYVARFDQMPSWESTAHPVANFKKNDRGTGAAEPKVPSRDPCEQRVLF